MNKATLRIETASEGSATGTKGFAHPYVQVQIDPNNRSLIGDVQPFESYWGDSFGQVPLIWIPKIPKRTRLVHYYGYDEQGFIANAPAT